MNLIGTILIYSGLLAAFLGGVSTLRPIKFLGVATRPAGAVVFLCGVAAFLIGTNLPASEKKISSRASALDDFIPAYQFDEFHSIRIKASRERVFQAIKEVRADEIFLFRTLVWIRRCSRSGRESILNPAPDRPILEVATRTSFLLLAEAPDQEIAFGTLVAAPKETEVKKNPTPENFKALHGPGFALAAMNFRLQDAPNGKTLVTTETRVYATDTATGKKFAAYWRVIYPGSSLIRFMWLRAIKRRAETARGSSGLASAVS